MKFRTELYGKDELIRAIRRNPQFVKDRSLQMMTRLKAAYQQTINRNPWRVGEERGGVPVSPPPTGGSLRDAHDYKVKPWYLKIKVRKDKAKAYGWYVHEGTSKMEARPWLDYAHGKERSTREKHYDDFLEDIVDNLAK